MVSLISQLSLFQNEAHTFAIAYADAQNSTSDALSPIATEIQTILSGAATEIRSLAGQPVDIVLGAVGGVGQTTVPELAELIGDLLRNVVGALGRLAIVLGPKIDKLLSGVLRDVVYVTLSFPQLTILIGSSFIL